MNLYLISCGLLKTPENRTATALVCGREQMFNRYLIKLLHRIPRISERDKVTVQGKKAQKRKKPLQNCVKGYRKYCGG